MLKRLEITSLTYGLEFLDRMVKTAKINIINANVRNAQTGDYYYNPYKIVNKTFTDTDGKQVTLKNRYYWCPSNADFGLG